MKTVLIVDDDLGFVFWLGRLLVDAGCQAVPAKGFSEAQALLDELDLQVDLLVVNPSLSGEPAFVDNLRRAQANLKVLAVLGEDLPPNSPPRNADIVARKPVQADSAAGILWVKMVEQALGNLVQRSGGI
jgi:DNA-binding NtrC family response regulator